MRMRRGKLLSVFLIYFFMFMQHSVLVYSSTDGHSIAARTDVAFEESNFAATSESDKIAVGSNQYDVQIANNNLAVSSTPTRESPIAEGTSNLEMEIEGDKKSGPGLATFILFCVVIAWITTAGGPKEN